MGDDGERILATVRDNAVGPVCRTGPEQAIRSGPVRQTGPTYCAHADLATDSETDDECPVTVEFFGIARERAGVATWKGQARTLGQLLLLVEQSFPGFTGLLRSALLGASPFRISLNGERFLSCD